MFKIILSLLLTISSSSFADTCDVAPIKKGDAAPCDGFYFNKDAEEQAEIARQDASFYKEYSGQLLQKTQLEENENEILQKRLNLYIQESATLAKEKANKDTTEDLIRIGYFSLGVFVTALIARNVRQ